MLAKCNIILYAKSINKDVLSQKPWHKLYIEPVNVSLVQYKS